MAPDDGRVPPHQTRSQAVDGRSVGVPALGYANAAPTLLANGYAPLPVRPRTKHPVPSRWSSILIDEATVECWTRSHSRCGVGLRTGGIVGIDIDLLDPDLAHRVDRLVQSRLGQTLMRIGRWPKRLLMYRTIDPFAKMAVRGVEILGQGQQFVAFGIHPGTGQPYHWPLGDTPLDVPLEDLPPVDAARCADLLGEVAAVLPPGGGAGRGTRRRTSPDRSSGAAVVRNADGLVTDGRDGWLSTIAYHAVHDAMAGELPPDPEALAATVWQRFASTAMLDRPRKDGAGVYSPADAGRKVADKLRLLGEGRLPPRDSATAEAVYTPPFANASQARERLDAALGQACRAIEAWHGDEPPEHCPRIGIRATVGLGKSVGARRHLLDLRARLQAAGAPTRLVVCTPSHALAEEAAAEWRSDELRVAVLRGYEARHPVTGQPMCRDIEAVRQAVAARLDVHGSACSGSGGQRCAFFAACPKQANRGEVEAADVVFASYDALFTGFATDPKTVGVILIDEGCWQRATTEARGLWVETFAHDLMDGFIGRPREREACAMADLLEFRRRAAAALAANGPGPVKRSRLLEAGLAARHCSEAAVLEERRLRDPGLYPGMPRDERRAADARVRANHRTHLLMTVWGAMAELLAGPHEHGGRLEIRAPAAAGLHEIVATGVRTIHRNFRGKPILHLDATLRPELARTILPELEVIAIDAAAPHMSVRLVAGSFGKRTLCQEPRAGCEENRRRANRLRECVDYVRWQALRVAPGRTLVVTYQACEAAFAAIPGIEVAHFNAIAGLDGYRDVRQIVIVGRPLPSELALHPLCGAFFVRAPSGGYRTVGRGVRMRDGTSRTVRVIEHEDGQADVLRAAICDDELIQAIGRGRGVNRTQESPLEVHVLADVALPLVHDRVLAWETVRPDIVQEMLLAGIAVDSPADAATLHPLLLCNHEQAKKQFERAGFKGQNPLRNTYREMSLKSAAYRRPGRGRSWQNAYWIDGTGDEARARLTGSLGTLAGWSPAGG